MMGKVEEDRRLTRRELLGSTAATTLLSQRLAAIGAIGPSPAIKDKKRNGRSKTFGFPSIGVDAENRAVLFAIDDFLLPLRRNLCYYLSRPKVRKEPILAPRQGKLEALDSVSADFYGTVLFDEGKFRMWYMANHLTPTEQEMMTVGIPSNHLCYAESKDGIHWNRPSLGQVLFEGSRANNALHIPDASLWGPVLLKDQSEPDPQRRYKLVYETVDRTRKNLATVRTATSADGIQWTVNPDFPIDAFLEQASFYKYDGLYIINAHTGGSSWRSEGGGELGRQGVAWVSTDFNHWLQEAVESFFLPEPPNPQERGYTKPYDQVHLGVGAASFGNVLVGLYCLWHEGTAPGESFGWGKTSGDFGLVVSNDGLHFREPVKGHVYLAAEESASTPIKGAEYPTILCQANGILNVGDETRIYHGRWLNSKSPWYGEIALATLPRDRWGALGLFPDQPEGSVWSAPITLPQGPCHIALNATDVRGMRVEVSDDRFHLLPDFSGGQSGTTQAGEGLDCQVTWTKQDLSALSGRTVRIRVHLKKRDDSPNPKLYAVYLRG